LEFHNFEEEEEDKHEEDKHEKKHFFNKKIKFPL
jgi:hypothetical protein